MKRILAVTKDNYQLIISAVTIAAVLTCFAYGQVQKANAHQVKAAIEKTR